MSQVSKRRLEPDVAKKIDKLFLESITTCNSPRETAEFLDDIFTPTEKVMISKRLAIAYLLIKGYPYNAIKQTLKVSTPTIGSVSLVLKTKGNGIKGVLNRITKREMWKSFFKELGGLVVDAAAGKNWKLKKSLQRQREAEKETPF